MSEADLRHRLTADPNDAEAAQQLADMLMRQEQPVPLDLQETVLRHHLAVDPARDDLGFRLAMILMEQGRPVPATLEMQALRHCIALEPERPDLYDRLSTVTLEVSLAASRSDRRPLATADDHAIVALAKLHLAAVIAEPARSALPSYGVRWGEYARRIREDIATLDDPVAATRYAQTRIGFEHRLPAAQSLRYMALYDRELRTEFPQYRDLLSRFQDPPQSDPDSQVVLEGRAVSNIVPYQTRIVLSCQSLIPAPRTVLELGGGHGGPARQWLTNPISPARTYIIVDIPESLFFAEVFLRATFGSSAVHYVADEQPLDAASLEQYRVLLCPVERLTAVENLPVDLIVNTGSLQEMSEEWVSYYMAWLDRQNARYFYSLNYAAQPLNFLAESINLWSPRPSSRWSARLLRWNPAFIRMQADRNYLEALFEKAPAALDVTEAAARLRLLAERAMTGEALVECMDVFRRCPRAEVAWPILRRAMTEMLFHPKEALWLAEWLEGPGNESAPIAGQSEITSFRLTLAAERASGIEGTT
jgi:putative sugar O-methyltransferase